MTQYNTTQRWHKLCKFQLCAADCSKSLNNKAKSMSCLAEHLSTYNNKKLIYYRAGEDSREKNSHHYYKFHLYPKNDGDDDEDEHINVESDVQSHEHDEVE